MSWGYWGIVTALVAMVGMLLACFALYSQKADKPSPSQGGKTEAPRLTPRRDPDSHRRAA
jgi:hypothetical protein